MNVPTVSFLISTNLVVVQVVVAIQALVAFLQNLGILKKKTKKTS
jgi:cbb3-type cytochrome oxidase cytochrome c subunit